MPRQYCHVLGCFGKGKKSFRFPSSCSPLCEKWIVACKRDKAVNINNARICSIHFSSHQYKRDLQSELLGIPRSYNFRCLKDDAVPDLELPPAEGEEYVSSSTVETSITTSTSNSDKCLISQKPIESAPSSNDRCDDIEALKKEIMDIDEHPMDISSKLETSMTVSENAIDFSSHSSNQSFNAMHHEPNITSTSCEVGKKRKGIACPKSRKKYVNYYEEETPVEKKTRFQASKSRKKYKSYSGGKTPVGRNTRSQTSGIITALSANTSNIYFAAAAPLNTNNIGKPSPLSKKSHSSIISDSNFYMCSVRGCLSTNKSKLLYPLPPEPDLALKWLRSLDEKRLAHFLKMNGNVPFNFLVCEKHFEKNLFKKDQFCKKLNKAGIPTKHLPSSENNAEEYVFDEKTFSSATDSAAEYDTSEVILPDHFKVPLVGLDRMKSSSISTELCYRHKLSMPNAMNIIMELKNFEQCNEVPYSPSLKWQVSKLHKLQRSRFSEAILEDLTMPSRSSTTSAKDDDDDDDDDVSQSVDSISDPGPSNLLQFQHSAASVVQPSAANHVNYYISVPGHLISGAGSNGSVLRLPPIRRSVGYSSHSSIPVTSKPEVDEKLSKLLDKDIRRLEGEFDLLRNKKWQQRDRLKRITRQIRTFGLPRHLSCDEKQAFEFCNLKVPEATLKFFVRQQLPVNMRRWEYNSSSVLPLLMLRNNNDIRKVVQSLYKLPSLASADRIKKRLRKNPSAYGNSPIMKELIKRQRVECRPPRPPKKRTVSNSVSEYLERFMQGN